jgi:hypothetical protein
MQAGFPDCPIDRIAHDVLEVKDYVASIAEFISCCETPMTIAIQGDWGSGKTSIMSMVRGELDPASILPVLVNTWHYSLFKQDEYLGLAIIHAMLKKLYSALGVDRKIAGKPQMFSLAKVGELLSRLEFSIPILKGISLTGKDIKESFKKEEVGTVEIENLSEIILQLREEFQALAEKHLLGAGKKAVFFIDDLDRVRPVKAVEVLEAIKNLLDIEGCVFVLAVDYEVVATGIHDKYGDLGQKGHNFFDKIIQVPFRVPVSQYNISDFVKKLAMRLDIKVDEKAVGAYTALIENSIGLNPRSIKRIFNSFILLDRVAEKRELYDNNDETNRSKTRQILFAVLCMEFAYGFLYKGMLKIRGKSDDGLRGFFNRIHRRHGSPRPVGEDSAYADLFKTIEEHAGKESVYAFLDAFCAALRTGEESDLSDSGLNSLSSMLTFAAITATTPVENGDIRRQKTNFADWDAYQQDQIRNKGIPDKMLSLARTIHDDILSRHQGKVRPEYMRSYLFMHRIGIGGESVFCSVVLKKNSLDLAFPNQGFRELPAGCSPHKANPNLLIMNITPAQGYTDRARAAIEASFQACGL